MVPEALDHAWIRAELAARRGVVGTPLCFEAQVGSTSDLARELAIAGAPHGTTVVADEQVAGRGRRGASRWQTPPRVSIALSTVLRPPGIDPSSLGRLGLCIAIATAEAIEGSTGAHVMVKWPNDLVVEARGDLVGTILKLGGILVEPAILAVVPPRVGHVVVGIGVNANLAAASMAPTDADALAPVALIDIVGHAVSRERLVVEILEAVRRETHARGRVRSRVTVRATRTSTGLPLTLRRSMTATRALSSSGTVRVSTEIGRAHV